MVGYVRTSVGVALHSTMYMYILFNRLRCFGYFALIYVCVCVCALAQPAELLW